MRELQTTHHVTDRIDSWDRGLKALGDPYETIFKINPSLLISKISGLRSATDGDQQHLCLEHLSVAELQTYAGVCCLTC
jgi:hypothetical protein